MLVTSTKKMERMWLTRLKTYSLPLRWQTPIIIYYITLIPDQIRVFLWLQAFLLFWDLRQGNSYNCQQIYYFQSLFLIFGKKKVSNFKLDLVHKYFFWHVNQFCEESASRKLSKFTAICFEYMKKKILRVSFSGFNFRWLAIPK